MTIAIVGASLAGAKAAEGLRDNGFTGRIVLIGEETERPYERPPLSKGYLLGAQPREKAYVHEAHWYAEHDVELLLGVRATNLDPAAHTLTLDGYEPLRYDKLLLATGSRVRRLDVPGAELLNVRYLRTLPEADALVEHVPSAAHVVVVGAGWIGLETAAAARTHGADVTVVELDRAPLRQVLGDEVAAVFTELHRAHGVTFRFGTGVREFRGQGGQLRAVVLDDGTELPADVAIVGIGITPATELAVAAGLIVDNGIVTDAGLRTSDPDIYACGDVANIAHPLVGQRIRVEHWSNALNGGKAAALALLGQELVYDRVPYFFSDQYDLGMEYSGFADPRDGVVFRGDPATREFIAFWVREGRVLARRPGELTGGGLGVGDGAGR
ncbi:MAG: FAD-dependent oxidoreductase [Actinobacteria bacterium 13_2_20CM_2_71_6]|nr:MAG: FAD-dependent oxidoreductase [Actinobacteria bacterium 13_2_20CM_2_71_6]